MANIRRPSKAEKPLEFGNKANRGRRGYPQARTVRNALNALQRMPPEAVADLVERLVDRLDAEEPDLDLEEDNKDACPAGEDGNPSPLSWQLGVGDADDAEFTGDEHERDDDDVGIDDYPHDAEEDMGCEDEPVNGLIYPEPSVQIGTVQSHVHGVDGVWVPVR